MSITYAHVNNGFEHLPSQLDKKSMKGENRSRREVHVPWYCEDAASPKFEHELRGFHEGLDGPTVSTKTSTVRMSLSRTVSSVT